MVSNDMTGQLVFGHSGSSGNPCVYQDNGWYEGTIERYNVRKVSLVMEFSSLDGERVHTLLCGNAKKYGCRHGGGMSALFPIMYPAVIKILEAEQAAVEAGIAAANKREQEAAERIKAERAERRAMMSIEVLEISRKAGGECGPDPYAKVRVIDPQTGERGIYWCRNIFDFGHLVNRDGGGVLGPDGWELRGEVIPASDFDRRAVSYLREFSPIGTEIRM